MRRTRSLVESEALSSSNPDGQRIGLSRVYSSLIPLYNKLFSERKDLGLTIFKDRSLMSKIAERGQDQ
jgi:hypothetical protein